MLDGEIDRFVQVEQGSEEWHLARLGKVTASRIADVMAKTKAGPSASRTTYMAELAASRLTGIPERRRFTTAEMQHGIDTEPQARALYAFECDVDVQQIGLVLHPTIKDLSASPDGLVGVDGLLEVKCPNTSTHVKILLDEKIDGKYMKQVQLQLACTEREWCDYVSYDPRLPEEMGLFIKRVHRDEKLIAEIEEAAKLFLEELDFMIENLKQRFGG